MSLDKTSKHSRKTFYKLYEIVTKKPGVTIRVTIRVTGTVRGHLSMWSGHH